MSLRDRTIHGIAWALLGRVGSQILQYAVSILMARLLTPADFGKVGMIVVFTGFASIFIDFGIGAALLERRNLSDEQIDAAFSSTLAIGVSMTLAFFLAAPWVAGFYGRPELTAITRTSALGFAFSAVGIVPRVMFQRRMEVKQLAMIDFTGGAMGCLAGSVMALAGGGVWAILAMSLATSASNSTLAFLTCKWRPSRLFHFAPVRPLVRMSLHLLTFNVINYWARTLDNLLVGKRLGAAQLAYYSRAYTLMLLPLSQVNSVISAGVLPAMAHAADDKPRVRRGYLDAMKMLAFVVFPMMIGLMLVADPFIRAVYGEKWAPAIPVLRILAGVGVLQSLSNPTGWIYVSQGRTDRMARWGLGACSAIIAALSIGAWLGSTISVAYAYLAINAVIVPIGIAYAGDLIGLTLWTLLRAIAPTILGTVGMAAAVSGTLAVMPPHWLAGVRLAIAVITGIASYLVLSVLLKNPTLLEARRLAKSKFGKLAGRAR